MALRSLSPSPSPIFGEYGRSIEHTVKTTSLNFVHFYFCRGIRYTYRSPMMPASNVRFSVIYLSQKPLLEVENLTAIGVDSKKEILHGVNLKIHEGEVHAIMGQNGSGKSTFSKVLVGHPDYKVTDGNVNFKGENLLDKKPEERSHAGLFMSFQSPVEIPGVSNMEFLRMAYNARLKKRGQPELEPLQFYPFITEKLEALNMQPGFLDRNVNQGFSGGERKRNEILQLLVLDPDLAILDEIDSGLDVDALHDVARAVNCLLSPSKSVLIITHYKRLLDYIKPTSVHIMGPLLGWMCCFLWELGECTIGQIGVLYLVSSPLGGTLESLL